MKRAGEDVVSADEQNASKRQALELGTQINVSSVQASGTTNEPSGSSSGSAPTSAATAATAAGPGGPAPAPGAGTGAGASPATTAASSGAAPASAASTIKPGAGGGPAVPPPRETSTSSLVSVASGASRVGAASTVSTTASQGSVASGPTATAPGREAEAGAGNNNSNKKLKTEAASSLASATGTSAARRQGPQQSGASPTAAPAAAAGSSAADAAQGGPSPATAAGGSGPSAASGPAAKAPGAASAATSNSTAAGPGPSGTGPTPSAATSAGAPSSGKAPNAANAAARSAASLSTHTAASGKSRSTAPGATAASAPASNAATAAGPKSGAQSSGTQKRKHSKVGSDGVKKESGGGRGGGNKGKGQQASAQLPMGARGGMASTTGLPSFSAASGVMPGLGGNAGAGLGGKAGGPNKGNAAGGATASMHMNMPGGLLPGMPGGQLGGMMGGMMGGGPGESPGGPGMAGGLSPAQSAMAAGQKQIGVEDALAYLNKVKQQFQDKPEVYNQFLEIMKNFKSQTIDTPGVIEHVCELFKGHDNLILGFNTFLPPGFKIELPGRGGPGSVPGTVMLPGGMQLGGSAAASVPVNLGGAGPIMAGAARGKAGRMQRGGSGTGGGRAGGAASKAGAASANAPAAQVSAPPGARNMVGGIDMDAKAHGVPIVFDDNAGNASAQGQPVEFDHAISYVTKIKKRFSEETDTYKSFLDILHSYQNEQRSINEVLEQVSTLFKDHPDLLKEFTYFLPDAVRESAKSELARRAAKAQKASQRAKDKTSSRRKEKKGLPLGDSDQDEMRVPQLERNLLGRIKAALGTRELWGEFLKCLDLFAQELISRAELLSLVSDILGERADLLEEFDRLLASRGATDDPVESAWFSMPLADIDFDNCRSCTPSYRGLPAAFPKAPCSERTALCRSVLNDTWVSVPFGSEDAGSRGNRRSPNEDALFRTEDDRYEVDLVIDSNLAAIRALEPLAQEIKSLGLQHGESSKFRYRLEKRSLSVIHLKAIARIYGDHGTEILELLRRNPAGAIPVILRRLKEKHEEWCRDRQELNKTWKEQMERNYLKSLDHRSFYFKQSEKRAHTQKVLLGELRDAHSAKAKFDQKASATQPSSEAKPKAGISTPYKPADDTSAPTGTVECEFPDPIVHQHAWGVISLKVERTCEKQVVQKIAAFYNYVFNPLFLLPLAWLPAGTPLADTLNANKYLSVVPRPKRREDALANGTNVQTPYGPGTVTAYVVESGFYTVALSFGIGHLPPGDVFKAIDGNEDDNKSPLMANFSKPVRMEDAEAIESAAKAEALNIFNTVPAYCFLRLYHMLYSRLLRVKELCETRETTRRVKLMDKNKTPEGDDAMAVDEGDAGDAEKAEGSAVGEHEYTQFLSLVYSLMNGTLDTPKFEDECRVLLGPEGYVVYTIEKLVVAIQKQLTTLVGDDRPREAAELYAAVEKPSEAATAHAARHPDPPVEVRGLAKAYSFVTNALVLPQEGLAIRARLEPGERADPNKPVKDPSEDILPLPKDTLIEIPVKKSSPWAKPPRLSFSLADLPLQVAPPASGSEVVPALVPVTAVYPSADAAEKVDRAARFDVSDVTKSFRAFVNADDKSLALSVPLYVVAKLPASKPLIDTISKFAADHGDSASASAVSGETWFAEVLAKTTAELEADKQAASSDGDVEMKA